MFTVKYVYPGGQEMISGPFDFVNANWVDGDGNHIENIDDFDQATPRDPQLPPDAVVPRGRRYLTVYCYINGGNALTLGPILPSKEQSDVPMPLRRDGLVFVMNDQGATVAKYRL